FENPDLDTDDAIGRLGFSRTVVDVSTQGVQRHTAFAIPFGTRNVGTAETATNVDANTTGAHADRSLHGTLHGATESHTAFQLLGNALGNQRRVGFRLAHFNDVDVHFAVGELLHLGADLVDVSALLADHDARTGGVDRYAALAVRALDDDLGDRGGLEVLEKGLADLQVFLQYRPVVANHRLSKVRLMPRRKPIGLIFWPIMRPPQLAGRCSSNARPAFRCATTGHGHER